MFQIVHFLRPKLWLLQAKVNELRKENDSLLGPQTRKQFLIEKGNKKTFNLAHKLLPIKARLNSLSLSLTFSFNKPKKMFPLINSLLPIPILNIVQSKTNFLLLIYQHGRFKRVNFVTNSTPKASSCGENCPRSCKETTRHNTWIDTLTGK